jgi:uroporphyrinogen-III synthase
VPRVILTRPEGRDDELAALLEAAGHRVERCPLVAVEPLGDGPVDVAGYDWVVVTSATGARELRRRMRGVPRRVAAIGPATARAYGAVDLVAAVATQEGLLAALPRPAGRVLVAAAAGARRLLVEALGADFVPLYRTVELRPRRPPRGDLAVLASPSAARALAALRLGVPVVTIGPETTRAAAALGLAVAAEAERPDAAGLAAAVERAAPAG